MRKVGKCPKHKQPQKRTGGLGYVNSAEVEIQEPFCPALRARGGGEMTLRMFSQTREDRIILHLEKAKAFRAVFRKNLFQPREGKGREKKAKPEKPHRQPLLCLHKTYLIIQCLQTVS